MKKQVVQATGNADQAYDQPHNPAPVSPAFASSFFIVKILDGGVDNGFAQGEDRRFAAMRTQFQVVA